MAEELLKDQDDEEPKPVVKRHSKKRREIFFEVEETDGSVTKYVAREMEGPERDEWLGKHNRRFDPKTGNMKDYIGFQKALIVKCVHRVADNKLVKGSEVDTWPSHVQTDVFEDCKTVNAATPREEEEVKKD